MKIRHITPDGMESNVVQGAMAPVKTFVTRNPHTGEAELLIIDMPMEPVQQLPYMLHSTYVTEQIQREARSG